MTRSKVYKVLLNTADEMMSTYLNGDLQKMEDEVHKIADHMEDQSLESIRYRKKLLNDYLNKMFENGL